MTLAKGIGNGFPLAAVVTTPGIAMSVCIYMYMDVLMMIYFMSVSALLFSEIAQTMTRALHFNTYGGNPMACAVGSAVIEVSGR